MIRRKSDQWEGTRVGGARVGGARVGRDQKELSGPWLWVPLNQLGFVRPGAALFRAGTDPVLSSILYLWELQQSWGPAAPEDAKWSWAGETERVTDAKKAQPRCLSSESPNPWSEWQEEGWVECGPRPISFLLEVTWIDFKGLGVLVSW